MAKKSTDKEAPEAKPAKRPAKKAAASAESKPKAAKPKTVKKAAPEEAKPAKTVKPRKKASAEPAAPAVSPEVIEEHIRVAAYYRWVERGMSDGGHEDDWSEAEKQIKG
jgi:hypothetical protein